MNSFRSLAAVGLAILATGSSATVAPRFRTSPIDGSKIALPTKEQLAFQDREIGVLVQFNLGTYVNGVDGCPHIASSIASPALFDPTSLNTDQWMDAIVALGGTYATLTAKHSCGFAIWPSKVTFTTRDQQTISYNYTIEQSPVHGLDVVKMFSDSAQKYNIGHGFYYSLATNNFLNVDKTWVRSAPLVPGQVGVTNSTFNQIAFDQLTELWTGYGNLTEIWFDGDYNPTQAGPVSSLLQAHQPQAVSFNGCLGDGSICVSSNPVRWIGTETGPYPEDIWSSGVSHDGGNPEDPRFCPAECDTALQNSARKWWYSTDKVRPLKELIDVYHKTVGHNCVLELGLTPDHTGLVTDAHVTRYKELGNFIRSCYGKPAADPVHTTGENGTYSMMFDSPTSIDRVVLMEDQTEGQVIRSYEVYAKIVDEQGQLDVPWSLVSKGNSVGHKRIDLFKSAMNVTEVMVNSTYVDTPKWRSVSVHLCDRLDSAFLNIQAESYTSNNGTRTQSSSGTGGGDNVGWIHNGNWLGYSKIDFGSLGATQFVARIASGAGTGVSGEVQVVLDSPTAKPVGTIHVSNTGGWQNWSTMVAN
ncbi:hypothetical protein VE04_09355, partial [Pseudogymnoascus sp. 24MN13]